MPLRVLITGGAGFIGGHLAAAWERRGAKVTVLDNLRTGRESNLDGTGVDFVKGTVEDVDLVARLCEGCHVVHHLAAMVSVQESVKNPRLAETINTLGTLNVLEGARRAGVGRFVFSSTCAVYGEIERPEHREEDPPDPISPYAVTKLAGENYTESYRRLHGLCTASLRYFNVYGPRQDPNSPYAAAVAIFAKRARAGEPLVLHGDGLQTRDFVHVDDVVAANILMAEHPECGVHNVAGGRSTTVLDLAQQIIALSGSASTIVHEAPREGDVRHSRGNIDRMRALGWTPKVSMEDGLRRTLAATAGT